MRALEEAIRVEEGIRNPDFTFRVDGKRKFFVETKKPSINIEGGIYPTFQVRRYAWSAGLPLSVLTDFEELAVYDCRAEPSKADKPAKARLMYLQYDQYVERWDEIDALFSREAVLGGSLDRFIESVPEKRGTKRVEADVAWFWIKHNCPANRGGAYRLSNQYMDRLPVHEAIPVSSQLNELGRTMLQLTEASSQARTDHEKIVLKRQIEATDRQIDALVYELYGLTEEGIRIVEEAAK